MSKKSWLQAASFGWVIGTGTKWWPFNSRLRLSTPRPNRNGWVDKQVFDYETSPNEKLAVQAIARRAAAHLPLALGDGERLPFADGSFAVVLSDHGALSFCDPEVILAECARVLAPGGVLAFCVTHPLLVLTWDADRERQSRRLHRSWNTLGRMDWGDGGTIDWVLTASEWIGTLTDAGFAVEACTDGPDSNGNAATSCMRNLPAANEATMKPTSATPSTTRSYITPKLPKVPP